MDGERILWVMKENSSSWFIKILGLMVLIMGFLVVGGLAQEKTGVGLKNEQWASKWGVVTKDPWLLEVEDLTYRRVVYNLTTKPGFKTMFWGGLWLMTAVIAMIRGVAWAYEWQKQQVGKAVNLAKEVSRRGLMIEIAGTVRVEAKRGTIYVATVGSGEMEPYTLEWNWLPIKIIDLR